LVLGLIVTSDELDEIGTGPSQRRWFFGVFTDIITALGFVLTFLIRKFSAGMFVVSCSLSVSVANLVLEKRLLMDIIRGVDRDLFFIKRDIYIYISLEYLFF